MRRRGPRLRLSLRITLSFALGGLLVSSALATIAYVFAYQFLVSRQEHDVTRQTFVAATLARNQLLADPTAGPDIVDAVPGSGRTSQAVLYRSGVGWNSTSLLITRDSLPDLLRRSVLAGQPQTMWTRINGSPQYVVGVPVPAANAAYFNVVDESALARTLATLRAVFFGAASATTAAGAGLGWWASRRLTRPLRSVTAASASIAAGRLDTHLPEERDADLAGLVTAFNTMIDSLRERIERDARFAADVSHELRSPLTTLRASLNVLETRRGELSERGQSALTLLAAEVGRFEHLVDDLLEISRMDAGAEPVQREPVRICELVVNVLGHPDWDDVCIDVEGDALDAVVLGDKRRFEQVVRNLLDNARMHGGGPVAVGVGAADGRARLVVDDAGPGVPAEDRERIFDRFARGHNAGRRGSGRGSGLGLALVREHVVAHGGTVRAEDRPGGGARFVVELPLESP